MLTSREHEVAVAIGRGHSNGEIDGELHMSVATVKSHVSLLFAKLEVDNRVQIALLVQEASAGPGGGRDFPTVTAPGHDPDN